MTEIKITKYRPGAARGARDLQRWSVRRLIGLSGTGTKAEKKSRKRWKTFVRRQRRKRESLLHPVEGESALIKGPQS